jgi:hypothetical protein
MQCSKTVARDWAVAQSASLVHRGKKRPQERRTSIAAVESSASPEALSACPQRNEVTGNKVLGLGAAK